MYVNTAILYVYTHMTFMVTAVVVNALMYCTEVIVCTLTLHHVLIMFVIILILRYLVGRHQSQVKLLGCFSKILGFAGEMWLP